MGGADKLPLGEVKGVNTHGDKSTGAIISPNSNMDLLANIFGQDRHPVKDCLEISGVLYLL